MIQHHRRASWYVPTSDEGSLGHLGYTRHRVPGEWDDPTLFRVQVDPEVMDPDLARLKRQRLVKQKLARLVEREAERDEGACSYAATTVTLRPDCSERSVLTPQPSPSMQEWARRAAWLERVAASLTRIMVG